MIDRESSRHLQVEHGFSLAEWRVLAFICSAGPASASEFGAAAEIDRAEISRAVGKLTQAGLIERNPSKENRRRLIISATPKGHATFLTIRDDRRKYFQEIMSAVPANEWKLLGKTLEAIAERVDSLR